MLDLNVLLDVIQKRLPHYSASAGILELVLDGIIEASIPAHALTTIHYIIEKHTGSAAADSAIDWLLNRFEVASLEREIFLQARALPIEDFEDAVVAALSAAQRCSHIITRNVPDFEASPIPALTPAEFLARQL